MLCGCALMRKLLVGLKWGLVWGFGGYCDVSYWIFDVEGEAGVEKEKKENGSGGRRGDVHEI